MAEQQKKPGIAFNDNRKKEPRDFDAPTARSPESKSAPCMTAETEAYIRHLRALSQYRRRH